nr:AMP-dependent synthetase and ligase [uncultured bacterium]
MRQDKIQNIFSECAAKFRYNLAVKSAGESITYGQLEDRSNSFANYLLDRHVAKGSLVAILVEERLEMITAMLGALKAGCAFVPLDSSIPEKRLEAMMSLVRPAWYVTDNTHLEMASRLAAGDGVASIICIGQPQGDSSLNIAADYNTYFNPQRPADISEPDDIAYIYFTSGTTGTPKAIAGRLKGISHFITWEITTLGLAEGVRVSNILPPTFDGSLRDIFVPLCCGGLICVPPDKETVMDGERLAGWIDAERINVIHCVPSVFRSIVNAPLGAGLFEGLRYILMAGEPLLPVDVGKWFDLFGDRVQLVNLYGTSETTMAKFAYFVQQSDRDRRLIPVGKPIEGARALLVDSKGRPCAPGTVGEIYIRTPYRALGYYNQPDLTKEAFIANPFSGDPNDIVYKTGDLGRVLKDGNYEFLGRADQQVKIRGVRVELDEIEGLLRGLPEVKDVAVIDKEDEGGTKFLCAYVVAAGQADTGALRGFLAERLPGYMVPSSIIFMESLPRTITGKIDRRALPAPGKSRAGLECDYVAPRNPVEELVASIWSQVLGTSPIGVHDSFFQLGGHSLKAVQVLSRVRAAFEVNIPLGSFFEAPTIAGLAFHIEAGLRSGFTDRSHPLVPVSKNGPLPVSYAQQRLWFLHLINPASAAYNIALAFKLEGPLNVALLEKIMREIVGRHEALRTNFTVIDGEPVQVISNEVGFSIPVIDLRDSPEEEKQAKVQALAAEEAGKPFNLSKDRLLRITLLRTAEQHHVALFTMHHIISDGWSMGILVKEVATLYENFLKGEASPLADLPIQYADYSEWQRTWMQGEALEEQLAFWKDQLGGDLPTLLMPADRPRPAVQTFKGASETLAFPSDVTVALKALGEREGATLFMVLLAAFDTLLHRYSGQRDIVVGTDVANRDRVEVESLIGFFVNQLVMRVDLSGNPTFRQLVRRVREVSLAAYMHQDLPFDMLVRAINPQRDLSHTPLFQVMLILQNAPLDYLTFSDLKMEPLQTDNRTAKFDLTFTLIERDDRLYGSMEYNTDLFDRSTIARMLEHFQTLLAAVAADPDNHIGYYSLIGEEEERQIVGDWNDTGTPYPRHLCVHHLFEEQVERTPDAVAIEYEDSQLTYRQLNERANRLAHLLMENGVGPDRLVVICAERSIEMIVGLLATLKAGGAYVPLDLSYPKERLRFIIADSQAAVILTQHRHIGQLPDHHARVICLDSDWEAAASRIAGNPRPRLEPENLAYLIYTSGSTGKPKGTMIPHRGVVNYLSWCATAYRVAEAGGAPVHSPIGFDLTVTSLFAPLIAGRRVVLIAEDRSLEKLTAALSNGMDFSLVKLTPSHLELLNKWLDQEPALARTRALIIGGEALTADTIAPWRAKAPRTRLINEYGPTETVVGCSVYEVGEATAESGSVPIGKPIANMQVYVLDSGLRPASLGIGEIYIGGAGLARGYRERPDLTADRFRPHLFSDEPGARLYKTGDLGRYLEGGNIDFLGRNDQQVKVRGHRVELKEIESVLQNHEAVCEAVVVARKDGAADTRLVAYVVAEPGNEPAGEDLGDFLKQALPDYMVPSMYVLLERLPLTPNGKLDHAALPDLEGVRATLEVEYIPPQTDLERAIATIWQEVLKIESVGVNDNFFDLGGHSLLVARVHSRLEAHLGKEIPIIDLFQFATVRSLASYIMGKYDERGFSQQAQSRAEIRKAHAKGKKEARKKSRQASEHA